MQTDLFARDQPRLTRIFTWDGRFIAQTHNGFHLIEAAADRALPVISPGDRRTVGMGTHRGTPVVLCRDGAKHLLFSRTNKGWKMEEIPGVYGRANAVLVCSRTHLVLVFPDGLCWRTGEDWVTTPLLNSNAFPLHDSRYLLDGERLLIGQDAGEWGGGLASVDLHSGQQVSLAPVRDLPVHDMQIDAQGRVWVAQGLAHLGSRQGFLHVEDGGGWKCVTAASDWNGDTKSWDLPPSSFDAVSFSPSGVLHMVGGSVGLLRLKDDHWERLTPDWPKHVYVSSLHMVSDDLALIGLYDAGVLVADLRARAFKRIILGWSLYTI